MALVLVSGPSEEPVTLAQAKAHCRADGSDDDALITALIVAARQRAEHETGRAFCTQTWKLTLDAFPVAAIAVPVPPLVSVTSVKYVDPAGTLQTLSGSAYSVHTNPLIGLIAPAYNTSWPATRDDYEAVTVDFTVGYGAAAAVPQAIKQWMLLAIGTWYAQREGIAAGVQAELPRGFWDALLDPFRVRVVA